MLVAGCRGAPMWRATTPNLEGELRVISRGAQQCVTSGSRVQGCFDGVDVHSVAFDSLGRHAAYAVRVGDRWGIALDGTVGALWDGVGAPTLSAAGDHLAYPADSAGRWRMVLDGRPGRAFDALIAGAVVLTSGSAHVSYAAQLGSMVHVVTDDSLSPAWLEVGELRYARTSNASSGPVLHYSARDAAGWHVVSDGVIGPASSRISLLTPLRSGVAFVAGDGAKEAVVMAGRALRTHDEIITMAVAPDHRFAYLARDGDRTTVLDASGEEIVRGAIVDLALGSAGRVAWVTLQDATQAVTGPHGTVEFDLVLVGSLQFVREGRCWAAVVGNRARRELRVVVNGTHWGRSLDWTELTRRIQQRASREALRSWVAAEGERVARMSSCGEAPA